MKKIITLLAVVFSFFVSSAQMSIETGNEKFSISRVYAGVLNTSAFSLENAGVSSNASLRIGGELSYQLSSKLSLNSFIANEISKDKNLSIANYYLKYHFSDKINLQIGQVATPATLLRPHPVSANGQFEGWSTSQLPGGGLGVTLSLFNSKFGVYKKGNDFEYHIAYFKKNVKTSMWYRGTNKIGASFDYKKESFQINFNFISKIDPYRANYAQFNYIIVHSLNKKNDLFAYIDGGWNQKEETSPILTSSGGIMLHNIKKIKIYETKHLQIGVLKYLSTKYMKYTIGGAYDYTSKSFNGYLQFNL